MIKRFFTIGLLSCFHFSCTEECGITAEPTLAIQFGFLRNKPNFTEIRALGSTKNIPKEGIEASTQEIYGDMYLPLNLNDDHTTYIFEQLNRVDTFTVFYQKNVYDINKKCGYILDLEAPKLGNKIVTTFKRTEVQYYGYYSKQKSFTYREGGGGIVVQIYEL
jgi:hypothetical protein